MHRNIFSPRVDTVEDDALSTFFMSGAQYILVGIFALAPIFFIPNIYTALGFMKAFLVTIGMYGALIFACLAVLRSGKLRIHTPLPLVLFWLFVGSAVASALLSGDIHDSFIGTDFSVQSAGFFILLAIVMTTCLVFTTAKTVLRRFVVSMTVVAIALYLYTFLRLFLGPEFLSFSFFTTNTSSLIGSLNDLAIFAGAVVLTVLVVAQRTISGTGLAVKALLFVMTSASLVILMIANFSFLWVIIGFASLLTFLYLVSKDTWLKPVIEEAAERRISRFTLALVALIVVVSGAFVVSGNYFGDLVSELSDVQYLEVRPSVTGTTGIIRGVYSTNALLGVGPNRFEDAWRLYKDPIINETQLWNTSFQSGSSFVSTIAVTTGLAGSILFLAFLGSLCVLLYRLLFVVTFPDVEWRFLAKVLVTTTVYLWIVLCLYAPGTYIMLLTALVTGITFAIHASALTTRTKQINVVESREYGFLLIAAVLTVIVSATVGFIAVNKQFIAQVMYTKALVAFAETRDQVAYDDALAEVSGFNQDDDTYVAERARLRLGVVNQLLTLQNPTEAEQRQFENTLAEGIQFAQQAIAKDATNPFNSAVLGSLYGMVNESVAAGISDLREQAFATAQSLDPINPEYAALQAQIAARFGDIDLARTFLEQAISLKNNFTDALFLSSQLDIQAGNATSAIATTRSIIAIDPYNPARYYQLGLLEVAVSNLDAAIAALQAAVTLDANYANARYVLALAYLDQGRTEEALAQLRVVAQSNADNPDLLALIAQVEEGSYQTTPLGLTVPVSDPVVTNVENEVTLTSELPDTNLVSPVNQPPREDTNSDTNSAE